MQLNSTDIEIITNAVIEKIKSKYFLIEKTNDLTKNPTEDDIKKRLFIDNVVHITCSYFKVDKNILKNRLKQGAREAIYCIYYLCRTMSNFQISFNELGFYFQKNHSTIIYQNDKCVKLMEKRFEFKYDVNEVKKLITESLKTK